MIRQGKTEVLGEKHYTAWVVDGWISTGQQWNNSDKGKYELVTLKPVPPPFGSPEIQHGLSCWTGSDLLSERPATNLLHERGWECWTQLLTLVNQYTALT